MNKKGFTLIEIIVCIIILSTIGVSTIVVVNKNNKTFNDDLNKKILSAANIFVEVEKDENGNNYLEEIRKGAKGVQIPVSMLVDKGYIDKNIENELYKNTTKQDGESYYVMFLGSANEYCDKSEITTLASWMEEGETVYLCKNYNKTFNELDYLIKNVNLKYSDDKFAVSNDFILNNGLSTNDKYTSEENGIFLFHHNVSAGNFMYAFYRGAVENNYIKLGQKIIKDAEGNETAREDLYWRIVWLRDDNKMKIVLDDTVPLYIENDDGELLDVTNKRLYEFKRVRRPARTYRILSEEMNLDSTNLYFPEEKFWFDSISFTPDSEYVFDDSSFYMLKTKEWYNSTNLEEYSSFITSEQNFCINDSYYITSHGDSNTYKPSKNFDCSTGVLAKSSSDPSYSTKPNYYSSKIGFLTYGDCIMAGIASDGSNLENSGNYLIKDNSNFAIQDISYYLQYRTGDRVRRRYENYYVGSTGLLKGETYYKTILTFNEDYIIYDYTGTNILEDNFYVDTDSNDDYINSYNFFANSIKPAMILDMTNYKLSDNSGTKSDYYTIIPK